MIAGGSRGIGAAPRVGAARGYDVPIPLSHPRRGGDRRSGAQVRVITVHGDGAEESDVAERSDVVRLCQRTDAELGPPTALVNNLGTVDLLVASIKRMGGSQGGV